MIDLCDLLVVSLDVCQSFDFSLTDVSVMEVATQWIGGIRDFIGVWGDAKGRAVKLLLCRKIGFLALLVSHSSFNRIIRNKSRKEKWRINKPNLLKRLPFFVPAGQSRMEGKAMKEKREETEHL